MMRLLTAAACLIGLHLSAAISPAAIEAVKGKQYELTKKHGPWMIVVASLTDRAGNAKSDAKTARQAADELIYELRTKGIPAYAFRMARTSQSLGEGRLAGRIQAGGQISVIAGNYASFNDERATKTLAWLKAYFPKCLKDGNFRPTPGRPSPLSGAFLTVNPLLTPDEVTEMARRSPEGKRAAAEANKLLRELNAGNPHPLSKCRGSHTLVVARFSGKSVTNVGQGRESMEVFDKFQNNFEATDATMDAASVQAWELCNVLRNEGVDAYLWHDQFESIVTVGSLNGPNDSRAKMYREQFGLTYKRDKATGRMLPDYKLRKVGGFGKNKNETRMWVFDPNPQIVPVPRVR